LGIVKRFLAEGALVTGFDLNETKAEGVKSILGDATDEKAVQQAVDRVVVEQGGLDVMVCNAGIIEVEPVVEMNYADWRKVMDINLNSVFLGSRAAARVMIAQGRGGVIVNASSGAGGGACLTCRITVHQRLQF
jgi:meso-butanediol dehydrogenase/(S,S)-butanediol dehydrogenase/diacetyl reductase